jgi:outer membrane protein with beta-barrel domain
MLRRVLMVLAAAAFGVGTAYAQEGGAGAGRVEIGAFPGGGMFFTQSTQGNEPDFGNYALGGSVAVNVNRWIGIEGEGGGSVGVHQSFNVAGNTFTETRTPSTYSYNGNVVFHPAGSNRAIVPYATAGLGGLTMSPYSGVENLGFTNYETFLAGNFGGGLKWFSTRHFGVRGDYRFFMVKGKDTAPVFFGNENRYGHRVQGGLVFTY